ncbi:hypothetical protein DFP73DRAFT_584236 [Morchella snyderi]|nr:hypothetical protein DFP73DRAFT_584236 [Morchella snyderi]
MSLTQSINQSINQPTIQVHDTGKFSSWVSVRTCNYLALNFDPIPAPPLTPTQQPLHLRHKEIISQRMACLNCTTRVLRIFLHTSQRPPLLPLPLLPLLPLPLLRTAAGLQRPAYARLATHLAARKQSTLATLGGELTDDDYVPFDYHHAGTVPAAIGAEGQSGWPPPVPEAGRMGRELDGEFMEREPDIELTSPHGEEVAWWDGMEKQAVAEEVEEGKGKGKGKKVVFLKREAYWTLDGGEQTYSLAPKNNKGKRKREREERERLAAAAGAGAGARALAPLEVTMKKDVDVAAPAHAVEETTAIVGEETTGTAESIGTKEDQEVERTANNTEVGSEEGSETASAKSARKAARRAWEEKRAARKIKIALKGAQKAARGLEKNWEGSKPRAAEREAAGSATAETEGDSSKAHKYDQFFSDTSKAASTEHTPQAPRAPREYSKSSTDRNYSPRTPKAPPVPTLQQRKRFGEMPGVLEDPGLPETAGHANEWNLQIPETYSELTRLQKWIATAPRNKIQPWQIYKARLQEKFKGQAWAPAKKLSPDAQEAIRVLRKNHPEITTTMLAEKFEVSGEAIRRILKSKWREQVKTPEKTQEWAEKWTKRGQKVWDRWEEAGIVTTKKNKKARKMEVTKAIEKRVKVDDVPVIDAGGLSNRIL